MNQNSFIILGLALALTTVLLLTLRPFFSRLKGLANDGALTVGQHEGSQITMFADDAP